MRTKVAAVMAGIMSVGLLTACGGGTTSAQSTGTVTLAATSVVSKWDPYKNDWSVFKESLQAVYDSLIYRGADGAFSPGMATEWGYSTPTTFEMTLREGVTFTDGTTFDAAVAKKNLDRAKTVTGPKTFQLADVTGVEVTDPYKLKLTLSQPNPSLPLVFTQNLGMMVSSQAIDNPDQLDQQPVGSGPYSLDAARSTPNDTFTFVKNDGYWDVANTHFNTYVLKKISDTAAALNALRSGQIDGTIGNRPDVPTAEQAGMKTHQQLSYSAGLMIGDREGRDVPALGDVRVRQALNYAMDREALQETIGDGTISTQLFPPGSPGNDPTLDTKYPYDPEKARQLLAEAGYGNGLDLTIVCTQVQFFDRYAQAAAQMLNKVGINATINNLQLPDYQTARFSGKTPTYAWFYNPADNFYDASQVLSSNGLYNAYKIKDPKVDELIARAAVQTGAEQDATFKELSAYTVDQAFFTITNFGDAYYFYNPKTLKETELTQFDPTLPVIRSLQPA